MTYRECAIVEVYTGICMLAGNERKYLYEYLEEIMGRPIYTHELVIDDIYREIRDKSKSDFLELCATAKEDFAVAEKRKIMTNREWLNSLSDDELAEWLCDCLYDKELSKFCNTPLYHGLDTIRSSYTNSLGGMKKWLKEERRMVIDGQQDIYNE